MPTKLVMNTLQDICISKQKIMVILVIAVDLFPL